MLIKQKIANLREQLDIFEKQVGDVTIEELHENGMELYIPRPVIGMMPKDRDKNLQKGRDTLKKMYNGS
ncbi:unnamed protein product [marine sediment metagenome]|uniref:Uncharacterized protein n=1 Tax=marine sediment metagenome TaxID=412755 RepID=X1SQ71_9ZZZZ